MKSAYDRAMERFGGQPLRQFSESQKTRLAEIDSLYMSRIAEAELAARDRLGRAENDAEAQKRVRDDLVVELASLRERCESEKNKVRNGAR